MNKKTVNKIKVLFGGLWARMEDNKEYFEIISVSLGSGDREYGATFSYIDDDIYFTYLGNKTKVDDFEGCELFDILSNYDSVLISYHERGRVIYLEGNGLNVSLRQGEKIADAIKKPEFAVAPERKYFVNPKEATRLLEELGILSGTGKIRNDKVRKYNQIDYFIEQLVNILDSLPKKDELLIMDCACGKSYLSFVLNYYIVEVLKKKCKFVGIDYSQTVIDASKKIAKNLDYKNMTFIKEDLTNFTPDVQPDIVVSLHACDTATDMAIALGIRAKAKAIISVPCCHKDVLSKYSYEPFSAVTRHGILKARLADTLTEGLRASYLSYVGYDVSLVEYISPLETPKNIMIRAIRTGKINEMSKNEYDTLKNLIHVTPTIEKFAHL